MDPGEFGVPDPIDGLDAWAGGDVCVAIVVDVFPCSRHRPHREPCGGGIRLQPWLRRHGVDGLVFHHAWCVHDVRHGRRHACRQRGVICTEVDQALHRSDGWLGGLGDHSGGVLGDVQHHDHLS